VDVFVLLIQRDCRRRFRAILDSQTLSEGRKPAVTATPGMPPGAGTDHGFAMPSREVFLVPEATSPFPRKGRGNPAICGVADISQGVEEADIAAGGHGFPGVIGVF